MKKIVLWTLSISALSIVTSCELLNSNKRSLRLVIKNYQNLLSNNKFDKAAQLCDQNNFVWIRHKDPKKKSKNVNRRRPVHLKGVDAIEAWHKSIREIVGQDEVVFNVRTIKESKPGVLAAIGSVQVRQNIPGSYRSMTWTFTMKWIKKQNLWRMIEFKERSPRKSHKS